MSKEKFIQEHKFLNVDIKTVYLPIIGDVRHGLQDGGPLPGRPLEPLDGPGEGGPRWPPGRGRSSWD